MTVTACKGYFVNLALTINGKSETRIWNTFMPRGYRLRHDVCCNKCLHTRCYSCSDHAREIHAAHERKNHGGESHAWKQERFHAAAELPYCRVCPRRFVKEARQIDFRLIHSKNNIRLRRRRCARPAYAGKICADVCRITNSSLWNEKARVTER